MQITLCLPSCQTGLVLLVSPSFLPFPAKLAASKGRDSNLGELSERFWPSETPVIGDAGCVGARTWPSGWARLGTNGDGVRAAPRAQAERRHVVWVAGGSVGEISNQAFGGVGWGDYCDEVI